MGREIKQSDAKQTDVCHYTALALEQATKRPCIFLGRFVCLSQGLSPEFQGESVSPSGCRSEEVQERSCLYIP